MLKKSIVWYLSFAMVLLPEFSFAQRKTESSLRTRKTSRQSPSKKTKTTEKKEVAKAPPVSNSSKEVEGVSLTCEEKYNLCMDNVCVNENRSRTYCDTSIDDLKTVDKDGEKFRIGNDLYTFARGVCSETLHSCDLKERNHIETAYKAKIKEDTLTQSYIEAINAGSDETQIAVLDEYMECMNNVCGTNFSDCFTIKNIERRASTCSGVLTKTSKPLTVKGMFYKKMEDARYEMCKKSGGSVNYDSKICEIEVTYGSAEKIKDESGQMYYSGKMSKFVTKKSFKVGEIVECTQEYFNVMNTEKPNLLRGLVDIGMGAVKSVAGVALIVVGAIATVGSLGSASANSVPMIMNGASLVCRGAGSTLNGAVKINTDVRVDSACFVNGNFITPMGTYFKVNFVN